MDISNYLDTAIFAVIAALIGTAVKYGFSFAVDLILKSHALTLVKAAESIYNGKGLGVAKYQFVADALVAFAAKFHIKLDAERVKTYIQAAVTDLHAALGVAVKDAQDKIEESQKADSDSTAQKAATQTATVPAEPTQQAVAQESVAKQTTVGN